MDDQVQPSGHLCPAGGGWVLACPVCGTRLMRTRQAAYDLPRGVQLRETDTPHAVSFVCWRRHTFAPPAGAIGLHARSTVGGMLYFSTGGDIPEAHFADKIEATASISEEPFATPQPAAVAVEAPQVSDARLDEYIDLLETINSPDFDEEDEGDEDHESGHRLLKDFEEFMNSNDLYSILVELRQARERLDEVEQAAIEEADYA